MASHFEKPTRMKGMLVAQAKRHLKIGLLLSALVGMGQYYRGREHKRKCKEFYCNYDIYADFKEMAKKGLFQSCVMEEGDEDNNKKKKK